MLNLKYSHFVRLVIGAVSLWTIPVALADVRAVVHFDSPLLRDAVDEINLNVYDSRDATVPLASQSYRLNDLCPASGEETAGLSTLEVVFSNLDTHLPINDYWVEPEVDGVAVGDRQAVSDVGPNMVVEGPIESRGLAGGFVFPDASLQTSAFTGEVDPTVNTQVNDGVSWLEVSDRPAGLDDGDDLGIITEVDPEVGVNTANYLPKWDGSKLVKGTIFDNGAIGIGTSTPDSAMVLHVNGFSEFDIGSGKLFLTTPGGRPGMIAFSNAGNRRDIVFHDDFLAFNVSDSDAIPALSSGITITNDGNVGIGTNTPTAKLAVNGWTKTTVLEITGGMDLSERFHITDHDQEILPGMVLSIDPNQAGELKLSREPYDKRVAGVVSGAGGVKPGMLMGQSGSPVDGHVPVALTGRVYVWSEAGNSPIIPGDLLTTSAVPGHAMKVQSPTQAQGAILGKAMTELKDGRGLVLVLVSLQ